MADCELCGSNQVGIYRTKASGAEIYACIRCIDKLGLDKPIFTNNRPNSPNPSRMTLPRRNDIMKKSEKELAHDFHIRIRKARESKGWEQREFARRMNERLNIVQRTENGNRPPDNLIKKIEKVLDIELMVDSEPSNTRQTSTGTSRNMTIGDAYEDLFSRRE